MELLYIWIEDFKNIKRQGFNLSPKHWFEFTPTETDGKVTGGILTHESRNSDYPDDFFGKNISNITAIVGRNGSGKSSLMEALLKFTLGSSVESSWDTITGNHPIINYQRGAYKGIFVFKEYDGSIFCFQNITLKNIIIESPNVIKQYNRDSYPFRNELKYTKERSEEQTMFLDKSVGLTPIFFSNIFREEQVIAEEQDKETYVYYNNKDGSVHSDIRRRDISLNSMLSPWSTDKPGQNFGVMNLFYWEEIKRLIYFISDFGNNWFDQTLNIKINLPKFLNIEDRFQASMPRKIDSEIGNKYEVHSYLIPSMDEKKHIFLSNLSKQILFIWIRWLETYRFDEKGSKQQDLFKSVKNILHESIDNLDVNSEIKNAFKDFAAKINKLLGPYKAYFPSFFPTSDEFLRKSVHFIENYLIQFSTSKKSINLTTNYEKAIDIVNAYSQVDFLNLFTFSFSFDKNIIYPVFSSGEKYFLSIYARLHDLRKELDKDKSNNNLLLLLDEAELTLHPEWQRNFIYETISASKKIFNGYQLQFLFSSHSPFLLSDLPKSNVIFLDKDENGNCVVRNPDDISQTFGANIHSLYRSSFFLENGFVGEFAKQKIDWVIGLLNGNNPKEVEKNKQEINFIIENIGEPLLRNKLREMYNGSKTVEDRIQALEEEIKQLQSLKDDRK